MDKYLQVQLTYLQLGQDLVHTSQVALEDLHYSSLLYLGHPSPLALVCQSSSWLSVSVQGRNETVFPVDTEQYFSSKGTGRCNSPKHTEPEKLILPHHHH